MSSTPHNNWSRGANNRVTANRIAPGFFVDAVNLDPNVGGTLTLRPGQEHVYVGNEVHGALVLGNKILVAAGTDLVEYDTATDSSRVLRTIAGAGGLCGDELGGRLYFCTANESLLYDGSEVKEWGVQTLASPPVATVNSVGSLPAGVYSYAITFTDADGREGGASDLGYFEIVTDSGSVALLTPEPPAGGTTSLYVGKQLSTNLYFQRSVSAETAVTLSSFTGDSRVLAAVGGTEPPVGTRVVRVGGSLFIAQGATVWMTHPLHPHICYQHRGFFQFPTKVTELSPVERGLFVHADQLYYLSDMAGATPQQVEAHQAVAVPGTSTRLPDKRVAWMSEYGQVIGNPDGTVEFITLENYVPALAERGGAGVVNSGGNQSVVSTMRGIPRDNPLAASDFAIAEVITP